MRSTMSYVICMNVCMSVLYCTHFLLLTEGCGSAEGGVRTRAAHNTRGRAAAARLSGRASHESSRQRLLVLLRQ